MAFAKLFGWSCGIYPRFDVEATGSGDELFVTSCSVDTVEVEGKRAEIFVPGTYLVITEPRNGKFAPTVTQCFEK